MDAGSLLGELGRRYGQTFVFSDRGVCSVGFDSDDVDFELAGRSMYFIAEVGSVAGRDRLFPRILKANLSAEETGGGSFAIDGDHGVLLLMKKVAKEMEFDVFEAELVAYLKALRAWKERLPLLSDEGAAPDGGIVGIRV
ncbi:MAG: type III secretion system chaperone [Mailhella sp.]|nr:type III secretion system chaperone [Mailhella sp.]